MKSSIHIQGNQLSLRTLEPGDADYMLQIENNPAVWEVSNNTKPYMRAEVLEFINGSTNQLAEDLQLRLLIERSSDHLPVGFIDLMDYNPLHRRAEVGILVERPFRRCGYAREALQLLVNYAFSETPLHQLFAYVPVSNQASDALFRSCGFLETGFLHDWVKFHDGFQDVYLLQRIKE